jgi:hypothetical protein
MGAFFGSVQVHGCTRDAVREAAERVASAGGIRCLVGPEIHGWVGVYPERQGQDQRVGEALAALLSADVLHLLLHDEDVFAYCHSMATDARGFRLALGGLGWAVYAMEHWRELLSSPAGIGNTVSLDRSGRVLVCAHRDGLEVVHVDDGARIATSDTPGRATIDPMGEHLLFSASPNAGISIAPTRSPEEKRHLALDPLPDVEIPVPDGIKRWAELMVGGMQGPLVEHLKGRAGQLERMQAIARGRAAGLEQSETVGGIGFSADGQWMWLRTSYALRVYQCAPVFGARGHLPKAAHIYLNATVDEAGLNEGGVNAVAEDVHSRAVLYSGWGGELRRMHLESGRIEKFEGLLEADPPQGILSIALSDDGDALGLVLRTRPTARNPRTLRDNRQWLQIWAYRKLVAKYE